MPRVPAYDSFQVGTTSQPNVRVDAPVVQNTAGQQIQQLGKAQQTLGEAMAPMALDLQREANQLRVDDAVNKAKEAALKLTYDKDAGYTNLRGINALERPNGKPLADEYADNLKQQIDSVAGGLGNDAQRQAFAMKANDLLTQFRGQALQHESKQFQEYAISVREGTISNRMNEIGLNYKDPKVVDEAVKSIEASTYDLARIHGKSAEWAEAQTRKMTSNAHKVAIAAALENNDIEYADGYLKKYSKQMDADDLLRVRGLITKEMDNRVGMTVAGEVISKVQPSIATSDAERAFNIALGTESNYRQFAADGKPLTSPKGAIGIAQVMPGTAPEAAKLANLPWDENKYKNDASYNKALGMAYFQKQLQDNGGDLAKAYAAYNAGPGALKQAIQTAESKGGSYLNYLPKETQNYVAKNMAAFNAGGGVNPKPTFKDVDDQLRADPRLANNPERYKIARADAERRFDDIQKDIKARDDEAVATAMRAVIANGGRFSDLPVSIRANLPPKEVDNVIAFAQKISKGDNTTNLRLYDRLTNDPSLLARMSDNEFFALRRELNEADFKHFSNERAKLTGTAPGGNGPGDLNTPAIKQSLDERLRVLKIDPSPKDDGGNDAARIGGIRKFVDQYFYNAQREAGKKFNDAEVAQHLDALFAKNATFRGFFRDSSGPMLGMKVGDLSRGDKDKIKAAYKRQGVEDPTDAQIMTAYWISQSTNK
jgi:soluble lytic murein transglycosylase